MKALVTHRGTFAAGSVGVVVPDARRTRLASMKLRWISAIARRWAAVSSGAAAIASASSDWAASSSDGSALHEARPAVQLIDGQTQRGGERLDHRLRGRPQPPLDLR